MTRKAICGLLLLGFFSLLFTNCGRDKKEPKEPENKWAEYSYGTLPQLTFGRSVQDIKAEEAKTGAKLTLDQEEEYGHSLTYMNYAHKGLFVRKYFFQNDKLLEVIQLIRPMKDVIHYDGTESFTLTPKFEEWAREMGFTFIKSRVKDYILIDEAKKIRLVVLPAQIGGQGEVYAEMHYNYFQPN